MAKKSRRRRRGEGSVEHLADGRWKAYVSLGVVDGRRRRRVVYARSHGELLAKLRTLTHVDPRGETVGQVVDAWLATTRRSVEPSTWNTYEVHVRLHIDDELRREPVATLTPSHVSAFYTRLLLSNTPANARKVATTLRTALRQHAPAVLRVPRPRAPHREFIAWTADEASRFLTFSASHWLYPYLRVAMDTGARRGELLALRWTDVDLDRRVVSIQRSRAGVTGLGDKSPKTRSSRRRVTLSPETVEVLRRSRRRDDWIFANKAGEPLKANAIREPFAELVAAAGVRSIRPHDLRHTCATLLLSAGVPVKVVSARLGHANPSTTLSVYAHVLPDGDAAAAATIGTLLAPKGDAPTT